MNNEVTNFTYYLFNQWGEDEATKLFGNDLGKHIYCKFRRYSNMLEWYANLDKSCRQKIVDRANELYNK